MLQTFVHKIYLYAHIGVEVYVHVLVKYQAQGTHACGCYIATCAKELSTQLEVNNEAKLMIGNTTKPTHGTVGEENLNLGRRTIVRKAIILTTSMQETWSNKGTMKPQKDVEGYKMPIAHPHKVHAPTLFEITIL
jgi:hypothetical protein